MRAFVLVLTACLLGAGAVSEDPTRFSSCLPSGTSTAARLAALDKKYVGLWRVTPPSAATEWPACEACPFRLRVRGQV